MAQIYITLVAVVIMSKGGGQVRGGSSPASVHPGDHCTCHGMAKDFLERGQRGELQDARWTYPGFFCVLAGSTKPKTPVRDYDYDDSGY